MTLGVKRELISKFDKTKKMKIHGLPICSNWSSRVHHILNLGIHNRNRVKFTWRCSHFPYYQPRFKWEKWKYIFLVRNNRNTCESDTRQSDVMYTNISFHGSSVFRMAVTNMSSEREKERGEYYMFLHLTNAEGFPKYLFISDRNLHYLTLKGYTTLMLTISSLTWFITTIVKATERWVFDLRSCS